MKRIVLNIIVFFLTPLFSFAQFWQPASTENYSVYDFTVLNENLVWGWQGVGYNTTLFRFQEINNEWVTTHHNYTNSNFPEEFHTNGISAISADTAFVIGTEDYTHQRMYKTTNGGVSWTQDSYDWNNQVIALAHIHFFNLNDGVVIGYNNEYLKVFTTNNGGQTWANNNNLEAISSYGETTLGSHNRNHFTAQRDNSVVFVTTRSSGDNSIDLGKVCRIFKSDDKGNSWYVLFDFSQNDTLGLRQFGNIDIKDNNTVYFTAYSTTLAKDLILYTTNNGATLNYFEVTEIVGITPFNHYQFTGADPINDTSSTNYFSKISTVPGSNLLVYSAVGGLDLGEENTSVTKYAVNNHENASSWITISDELLHDIEFLSPSVGFASNTLFNFPALYKYNSDFMSIQESTHRQIQVFPNPVKNSINFSEELNKIIIFDLSGKKMKSQLNSTKTMNVSDLPIGTYLIKGFNSEEKAVQAKFIKK